MSSFKSIIWLLMFYAVLFVFPVYGISEDNFKKPNATKKVTITEEEILAKKCWDYRYNNPDSARLFGYQALALAEKRKNLNVVALAYHNLAITYEAQTKFEKAIDLNLKSLSIKKSLKDEIGVANSLNNLGGIYDQKGDFSKAVKYYKEAYGIYKKNSRAESVAMINVNLGIVFKAQKEYSKVIKYYLEAYEIYKSLEKPFEIGASEANLGSVYLQVHNYDSCIYYSKLAEQKFIALKVLKFLPVVRANIGIAYGEKNNKTLAIRYLEKAAKSHQEFNNKKELAFTLIHLAKNYQYSSVKKALSYANEAFNIAKDCSSVPEMMEAKKLLAELYKNNNNYILAFESFEQYNQLKDSLFKIEKNKELNEFNVLFETEKKERRITELNQESTIQKLEIKQKSIFLYASLVLIGFSVFTAYLLINRRKIKEQIRLQEELTKQQEIRVREVLNAEERERRRIAGDLHDGVGQTLSAALMNLNSLIAKAELKDEQQNLLAQRSLALVNESYDEMRSISHQMMPNALLKSGLSSAIREFISKIDEQQLKISLEIVGLQESLEENTETVIYRVIQEATNNVIKHAKASKLTIQIVEDEENINVSIEDNGAGFDTALLKHKEGIGFKNIRNRIASLNGELEIDSKSGKGTLINFYLPLSKA